MIPSAHTDTSPTAARLHEAWKARRAKEAALARRVPTANQNERVAKREAEEPRDIESFPMPRPFMAKKLPLWTDGDVRFDAHVTRWLLHLAEVKAANGAPLRAYIKRRCLEIGISYNQITGQSRVKPIALARQLLMWEIKRQVRPAITWPELGRLFGGRDHTTALHGVRRIDDLKAKGEI